MINLVKVMVIWKKGSRLPIIFRLGNDDTIIFNGTTNLEKISIDIIGAKKIRMLWSQLKHRLTTLEPLRSIGLKPRRRRPRKLIITIVGARRRAMKVASQNSDPLVQLIINPSKLPATLHLICRDAKSRQHHHENQAIPELQPPLDGFENFHPSMQ